MKHLTAIILLMFVTLAAHAQGITVLLGATKFTPHGDGVWYQKAFHYNLNTKSSSIGLRYDTAKYGNWSAGVGYMHLGQVSTGAQAVGLDGKQDGDGGYNPSTKACNGPCWPLSNWYGSGSVQGIFGVATRHFGPWSVDAGLYLYKPQWTMHIPDWVGCRTCAPQLVIVQAVGNRIGPVFGVRHQSGAWSITGSAWYTKARGGESETGSYPAIYNGWTYNISTGYTF